MSMGDLSERDAFPRAYFLAHAHDATEGQEKGVAQGAHASGLRL